MPRSLEMITRLNDLILDKSPEGKVALEKFHAFDLEQRKRTDVEMGYSTRDCRLVKEPIDFDERFKEWLVEHYPAKAVSN